MGVKGYLRPISTSGVALFEVNSLNLVVQNGQPPFGQRATMRYLFNVFISISPQVEFPNKYRVSGFANKKINHSIACLIASTAMYYNDVHFCMGLMGVIHEWRG